MRARSVRQLAVVALATVGSLLVGCAGHESRVRDALDALDRNAPDEAIEHLNTELGVTAYTELPLALEGDNALLVLDRASIQLSLGRYVDSARDFGAADKAIELLDMRANAADDLGKYLFSDSVGRYRAPAYEKVMINTMNLQSYLGMGKLEDAKVEARRLAVLDKFLADQDEQPTQLGIGSYLAGFAFEKANAIDEALVFYEDALEQRPFASLGAPLARLTSGKPRSKLIEEAIAQGGPAAPLDPKASEIVVVVNVGRVPEKEPRRIPIGLALTMVSGALSPNDHARANELAAKGLVTWVNFPTLGKSRGALSIPNVAVDGQPIALEEASDVEAEARAAFEKAEGTIILSAITRLLARAAAGELTQLAAGGGQRDGGAGVFGVLAGLAATATLTALDTPDTRAWVTLPSRVFVARITVPAGNHTFDLSTRGLRQRAEVTTRPGGWAVVSLSALR